MRHTLPIAPQFYVTAPQPCPYLEGRMERKLFTALQGEGAQRLNDSLSKQGFRRSQNVLYRPSCADCAACLSARINVNDFTASKSQRKTIKRNQHLMRRATSPWATEEQYELFRRYLEHRHANGGMADMDTFEFAAGGLPEGGVDVALGDVFLERLEGFDVVDGGRGRGRGGSFLFPGEAGGDGTS